MAGAVDRPIPVPRRIICSTIWPYGIVAVWARATQAYPAPTSNRPAATTILLPILTASAVPMPEEIAIAIATGSVRTPASSAL